MTDTDSTNASTFSHSYGVVTCGLYGSHSRTFKEERLISSAMLNNNNTTWRSYYSCCENASAIKSASWWRVHTIIDSGNVLYSYEFPASSTMSFTTSALMDVDTYA